jgi:hypothetical protein
VELGQSVRRCFGTPQQAAVGIIKKLRDQQFSAGFRKHGGKEFLSYMNIGESFARQGGQPWQKWNSAIFEGLAQVQNADGSWSGHHCNTGWTLCTATGLFTLLAARAPSQLAAQIERQK